MLTNARIVFEDAVVSGSLEIDAGIIRDVDTGSSGLTRAIDCEGDFLVPGLIDLHTDNLERHFQPRQGVFWDGVTAAIAHDGQIASSGITTVFDSLVIGAADGWDTRDEMIEPMLDGLIAAYQGQMLRVDHLVHMRCEITHADLIETLMQHIERHDVHLVSLMDHAPGDRQSPDIDVYRERFIRGGATSEDADRHIEDLMQGSRKHGPGNRRHVAGIARERGIPLATHDDATPEHIDEAVRLGACFTEFPTTVGAASRARERSLATLMGSPNLMRGLSHSGNVAAGDLLRDGLLDVLASDYVPASLLNAVFQMTKAPHGVGLPEAIGKVTWRPADIVGLKDRGRLTPGQRADMLRVRLIDDRPILQAVYCAGRRVA